MRALLVQRSPQRSATVEGTKHDLHAGGHQSGGTRLPTQSRCRSPAPLTSSARTAHRTPAARGQGARARRACGRRPAPPPSCARARRPCRGRARPPRAAGAGPDRAAGAAAASGSRDASAPNSRSRTSRASRMTRRPRVQELVGAGGVAAGHGPWDGGDGAAEVRGEVGGDEGARAGGGLDDDRDGRERGDDAVARGEAPAVAAEAGRHLRHHRARIDEPRVQVAHAGGIRGLGAAREDGDGRRGSPAGRRRSRGGGWTPIRDASRAPRWAAESIPSAMPEITGTPAAVTARPRALATSRP